MVNVLKNNFKPLANTEITNILEQTLIPNNTKLLQKSEDLIEQYKALNEEIIEYVKREKDYKLKENLYKTKLIVLIIGLFRNCRT